jgi:hypothetical protein
VIYFDTLEFLTHPNVGFLYGNFEMLKKVGKGGGSKKLSKEALTKNQISYYRSIIRTEYSYKNRLTRLLMVNILEHTIHTRTTTFDIARV